MIHSVDRWSNAVLQMEELISFHWRVKLLNSREEFKRMQLIAYLISFIRFINFGLNRFICNFMYDYYESMRSIISNMQDQSTMVDFEAYLVDITNGQNPFQQVPSSPHREQAQWPTIQ